MSHFETVVEEKNVQLWYLTLIVQKGLIRSYLQLLFEERTSVFSHPAQSIHLGELAPDQLWLAF